MTDSRTCPRFDFDRWARLARQHPKVFEHRRARVIEAAICRAAPQKQPRLRRLQWKLDAIRQTSNTPMDACQRINRLLWEALAGRNGLIAQLNYLNSPGEMRRSPELTAEIHRFPG